MWMRKPHPAVLFLFGFPIFLGAFLLFAVQPVIAKLILPWFGGTAGVWITCLLFFQVALLAGYAYSFLIAALFTLPILPADHWKPLGAPCSPSSSDRRISFSRPPARCSNPGWPAPGPPLNPAALFGQNVSGGFDRRR